MSLIERVYASGGDVIIDTLELTCPAWTEPVLICAGFEGVVCTAEDGRSLQLIAAGIDVSIPKKSNSASQALIDSLPPKSNCSSAPFWTWAGLSPYPTTLLWRTSSTAP